jgi:hypothetical protein
MKVVLGCKIIFLLLVYEVAIFRPTRRSLLQRTPGWTDNLLNFFFSGLQKLEQRVKKCIEIGGEYVE